MTPRQIDFVKHKLMGLSNRTAVIASNYSTVGAKQRGTRLMHNPRIRTALLKGGFYLAAAERGACAAFEPSAGLWKSVSPAMPKEVYCDPIEFLTDAMNCTDLPVVLRGRFATALMPYQHAKARR